MNQRQIEKRRVLKEKRRQWGKLIDITSAPHDDEAKTQRTAWILHAIIIICALGLAVLPAFAHSWYSQACCSGKDCAPIPATAITETGGGWIVELTPGDHPMVTTTPFSEFVPFDSAQTSQDGDYHACVRAETPTAMTPTERVICLYVPNPGGTS